MGATVSSAGCSTTEEQDNPTQSQTDTEPPTNPPTSTQNRTTSDTTRTDTTEEETATEEQATTTEEETTTEEQTTEEPEDDDEQQVEHPANHRWDMKPGRNTELRRELGQYVNNVGGVIEDHPAFDFTTERENDDHTIDFNAQKMIRNSNFAIMKENGRFRASAERVVESFVDDSMYSGVKKRYLQKSCRISIHLHNGGMA